MAVDWLRLFKHVPPPCDLPLQDDADLAQALRRWASGVELCDIHGHPELHQRMGLAVFRYWPEDEKACRPNILFKNHGIRKRVVEKVLRQMNYYRKELPCPAKVPAEIAGQEAMYF